MSDSGKSFGRFLSSLFGSSPLPKRKFDTRKLTLESLEARELLSVSPLLGDPGSSYGIFGTEDDSQTSPDFLVEVETIEALGKEAGRNHVVDPMTPQNLRREGHYGITVKWDAVDGAASYVVQHSRDGYSWSNNTASGTDWILWNPPFDEHYFRIASVDAQGNRSEFSDIISERCYQRLDSPIVTVLDRTENHVLLQWTPVDNAGKSRIDVSYNGGQTWSFLAATHATNYLHDINGRSNETISYRVYGEMIDPGYRETIDHNICVSAPPSLNAANPPSRPSGVIANASGVTSVTVQWNAIASAESYKLQAATSADGPWSTVYEGGDNMFSHDNLVSGIPYYYRVVAVNEFGDSSPSYVMAAIPSATTVDPMTPAGFHCGYSGNSGIWLEWNPVDGAVGYRLQSSRDGASWYNLWGNRPGTSTADQNIPEDTFVYYRVASFDSNNVMSEYSNIVLGRRTAKPELPSPRIVHRNDKTIVLAWDPIDNALTYCGDVSKDGGATWERVIWYTNSTFSVQDISDNPSGDYLYRVCVWGAEAGYSTMGDYAYVESLYDDLGAATPLPTRPSNVKAFQIDDTKIGVSWNENTLADSYLVERTTDPSGDWSVVYEGTSANFVDRDLNSSTLYYYRVSSVNESGTSGPSYLVSNLTKDHLSAPIVFRIHRSGNENLSQPMTVYYRLSGTAANGSDYTITSGSYDSVSDIGMIEIPAGATHVDLRLDVIDDTICDPDETAVLTLLNQGLNESGPTYAIGGSASALAMIEDDDPAPIVRIDSVRDGIEGSHDGFVRLKRDRTEGELIVRYRIVETGTTAIEGEDFTIDSSTTNDGYRTIMFGDGEEFAEIPITVIDDAIVESDETIRIELLTGESCLYVLEGTTFATVTIEDNDTASIMWIDSAQNAVENGADGCFVLKRENTTNRLEIAYTLSGTAVSGTDYSAVSGVAVFEAGSDTARVEISSIDNNCVEDDRSVILALVAPVLIDGVAQYVVDDSKKTATLWIENDDETVAGPPTVWIDSVQNAEEGGQDGFFRLRRDNTQGEMSIDYSLGGTAKKTNDYRSPFSSVRFLDGQYYVDIPIQAFDNIKMEGDKTVILTLISFSDENTTQSIISNDNSKPSTATLLIIDNDIASSVWIGEIHNASEGQEDGSIRLYRDSSNRRLTVYFSIDRDRSSAALGEDYEYMPGTSSTSNIGCVTFEMGEEFIDIPIKVINDTILEGTEFIVFSLICPDVTEYSITGNHEAKVSIIDDEFERGVKPQAIGDYFTIRTSDHFQGNVLENDVDAHSGEYLPPELVSVVLGESTSNGILTLAANGTFQYVANSGFYGMDTFSYRLSYGDSMESNVVTVTLIVTPQQSGQLLPALSDEDIPEIPGFDNDVTFGGTDFVPDAKSGFTPELISTYTVNSEVTRSLRNENQGNVGSGVSPLGNWGGLETMIVEVNSEAYENGDWFYSEYVYVNYEQIKLNGDITYGYQEYAFFAWSIGESNGFIYCYNTQDIYSLITSFENSSDTANISGISTDAGTHRSWTLIANVTDTGGMKHGVDAYSSITFGSHELNGWYVNQIEGGEINGKTHEISHSFDSTETAIFLTWQEDLGWIEEGYHFSNSNGISGSDSSGSADYIIEKVTDEADEVISANIAGTIHESGMSISNYAFVSSGMNVSGIWQISGTGTSSLFESSDYEKTEKGDYTHTISKDDYQAESRTTDETYYLDKNSVERDTLFELIDGTWIDTFGIEEEMNYMEDNYSSSMEGEYDNDVISGDYWEEIQSKKKEDSTKTSMLQSGHWLAAQGIALSYTYGKYDKGNSIDEAEYTREIEGGTIEGTIGTFLEESSEFEYDSRSIIELGDWKLNQGTAFYSSDSKTGDYYKGSGEYESNHEDLAFSRFHSDTRGVLNEEAYLNVTGTRSRVKLTIADGQWEQQEKTSYSIQGMELTYFDIASGNSVQPAVAPKLISSIIGMKSDKNGIHNRHIKVHFSDWSFVRLSDETNLDNTRVAEGQRTIAYKEDVLFSRTSNIYYERDLSRDYAAHSNGETTDPNKGNVEITPFTEEYLVVETNKYSFEQNITLELMTENNSSSAPIDARWTVVDGNLTISEVKDKNFTLTNFPKNYLAHVDSIWNNITTSVHHVIVSDKQIDCNAKGERVFIYSLNVDRQNEIYGSDLSSLVMDFYTLPQLHILQNAYCDRDIALYFRESLDMWPDSLNNGIWELEYAVDESTFYANEVDYYDEAYDYYLITDNAYNIPNVSDQVINHSTLLMSVQSEYSYNKHQKNVFYDGVWQSESFREGSHTLKHKYITKDMQTGAYRIAFPETLVIKDEELTQSLVYSEARKDGVQISKSSIENESFNAFVTFDMVDQYDSLHTGSIYSTVDTLIDRKLQFDGSIGSTETQTVTTLDIDSKRFPGYSTGLSAPHNGSKEYMSVCVYKTEYDLESGVGGASYDIDGYNRNRFWTDGYDFTIETEPRKPYYGSLPQYIAWLPSYLLESLSSLSSFPPNLPKFNLSIRGGPWKSQRIFLTLSDNGDPLGTYGTTLMDTTACWRSMPEFSSEINISDSSFNAFTDVFSSYGMSTLDEDTFEEMVENLAGQSAALDENVGGAGGLWSVPDKIHRGQQEELPEEESCEQCDNKKEHLHVTNDNKVYYRGRKEFFPKNVLFRNYADVYLGELDPKTQVVWYKKGEEGQLAVPKHIIQDKIDESGFGFGFVWGTPVTEKSWHNFFSANDYSKLLDVEDCKIELREKHLTNVMLNERIDYARCPFTRSELEAIMRDNTFLENSCFAYYLGREKGGEVKLMKSMLNQLLVFNAVTPTLMRDHQNWNIGLSITVTSGIFASGLGLNIASYYAPGYWKIPALGAGLTLNFLTIYQAGKDISTIREMLEDKAIIKFYNDKVHNLGIDHDEQLVNDSKWGNNVVGGVHFKLTDTRTLELFWVRELGTNYAHIFYRIPKGEWSLLSFYDEREYEDNAMGFTPDEVAMIMMTLLGKKIIK